MFPFDLLNGSELGRRVFDGVRVRIWERRAGAFWRPGSQGYYTIDRLKAGVFEFRRAWEIATIYCSPSELFFEPVNEPVVEPEEEFRRRWTDVLKRLREEAKSLSVDGAVRPIDSSAETFTKKN
jgi:hypothetical protein